MGEWKEYLISDLAEIHNQARIPLSKMQRAKKQGLYPYYGASGIIDYVDEFIFEGEFVLVSEDGENLKSRKTPIAFKATGQFWVNNHAHILKGKKSFYNDLIVYYFKNLDLNQFITGAVQPKLNKANLLSIPIILPEDESAQKAIVSVLSSLDDKIDLLHRQNKTLESMSETLFRQWLIEEAKDDWEEGRLGDVIDLHYGKGLKQEIRTGTGYSVIGSSGVVGYHSEYLVEGPGVVIGRKGTLGQVIYLWDNFFPIDTTYYVKSKTGLSGLAYEYYFLKTLNFKEMNSDSAVPGLNRDLALSSEIKLAPIEKIQEFSKIALTFLDKINTNNKQINTLEKTRNILLPKLMSGEVKVEI